MFGKLFGGKQQPAAAKQPEVNPQEMIEKLNTQIETVEKRSKVLENRCNDLKATALQKKKAKDNRGALMAMKQMKMVEKELAKLDGQQVMLTEQKMMIESTHFDVGVINTITNSKNAMSEMNKKLDNDEIADLKDELADMQAENEERQAFFAEAANAD